MSQENYTNYPQQPPQKISAKKKTDSWREMNVDAIDGMATNTDWDGRSSRYKKQVNYDLVNSIFDENDYDYVLNPFNLSSKYGGTPAKIRDINLVRQKVELLKGEELARPFDFLVSGIGGEVVSVREEKKKEMMMELAQYKLLQEAGLIDPETGKMKTDENGEPLQPPPYQTFEEIENHFNTSYTDIRERWGSDIIRHGYEEGRLQDKFNRGFEHGLIAAEEIYYVGMVAGEPRVRVCNPLNCEWDKGPELERIEDADWFREERWLSVGQVLDEYSEFLTEAQVDELDKGLSNYNSFHSRDRMFPGFGYTQEAMRSYEQYNRDRHETSPAYIRVVTCTWKSMLKIGFVTYTDPITNEEISYMVDETHKLTEEEITLGAVIDWQWVPEVWQGTKIGNNIYADINPIPNQMRTMTKPAECKLPYVGRVYNNNNTQAKSLVDLMKPHQYLYNIIWYRIENEIAKAKGKKMVMDMAQIPKSMGIDMKKWMYYFDNLGIALINSFEEGTEGTRFQGQTSQFNQYTAIDLSLSNVVAQYIAILDKIEYLLDSISGVSRQREGAIHQNETASGVERSLSQSSYITEYYFFTHNEIRRQVLQHYIEVSKYAYANGKRIHYITDDLTRQFVEIDGEIYNDSDYGVYVTNSSREKLIKSKIESLAQIAMQQDKAGLSDMIKIFKATSTAQLEREIKQGEQEKERQQAEQFQQEQETRRVEAESVLQDKREEREWKSRENQLDRENNIDKAVVMATGFDEDKDRNNNNIPDVVEIGKQTLEASRQAKESIHRDKDRAERAKESDEQRKLEREKMDHELKLKKMDLKNPVPGEKTKK